MSEGASLGSISDQKVYEAIADTLGQLGVERIFGLLGDANLAWVGACVERTQSDFIAARHEGGAVAMADGYARARNSIAVATVTHGPGLSNGLTALRTAVRDRARIVLITGDTSVAHPLSHQNYNHQALVEAVDARYVRVEAGDSLERDLRLAFESCDHEPGPVVVDIPVDIMTEPTVPSEKSHSARAAYEPAASRSSHDPSDISHIAKRLREAQHPLILAGLGALESNAAAPIAEIVAVSGAPLATTLPAKDMFGSAEIPELAALFGGFGTPELKRYMEEMCDLLVVFGASLNRFTTEDGLLTRNCQIVQVDRDPDALGKETPIDFGVVGDARAVAADLVRAIQDWGRTRKRQEIRWIDPEYEDLSTPGGLDPRTLMRELDAWLPDSARVVCDGGHFIEWPARYLRPRSPGGFWLSIAGGSIGLSLPISIGMALAGDDRPAIAMMGDGSFFMGVAELETAKRTRAQLCAIVLNDKAYSAEVHRLRAMGMSPALAEFPDSPSVADVAASFGVSSRTIGSLTELRQFVREPFPDEPFVLEARITTKVWATRWRREEVRN